MDSVFLRASVLLLTLWGLSAAVPPDWLPGSYQMTAADAERFAGDYSDTAERVLFVSVSASWTYNTNLTTHNSQAQGSRLTYNRCTTLLLLLLPVEEKVEEVEEVMMVAVV
ncbi:hypothetical protein CRUP_021059 [Coryphaenoides rupestris]|nr:hypothetical protein CRUP_021059 [Coryphaenoides rupestris]